MPLAETLAVLMVAAVCGLLFFGYPVALTLGGVSLAFAALGHATGAMSFGFIGALPGRVFGVMTNDVLLAIPMFVFMGVMLERSRIAEELLETMGRLFGTLRGGLGISVTIVGAMLAASTGIVGATAVTMGLIVLPAMLRHGYAPALAAGTVAASATLAQIIPPSTVLILLGDQLGTAYQAAQLSKGIFAPAAVTVSDLFAGAIGPGVALVAMYILFLAFMAAFFPKTSPAIPPEPNAPRGTAMAGRLAEVLIAPLVLIVAVLGSILGGIATPTEAASIGAIGAILLTARRDRLSEALGPTVQKTAQITAMIFLILIGATLFSLVFRGLGGDDLVHRALSDLPGGVTGAILVVMLAMFLLGFVMDAFEIIFVVVPIVAPALLAMPGVDPVWLGVMMALNLQTSYMHPPLGPTLFFLRGVAPPEITTRHIYLGIVPFVLIQLFALVVLWTMPGRATALPRMLYGGGSGPHMKAAEIFDLTGRVALVTGASSGLGRRFAQVLAANGASVALVARRADRLKELQASIEKAGGKAIAVEADVLDRAAMTRAFDRVEKELGTVTILVNNAGVAHSTRATDLSEGEWRRIVGTNLDAVFAWAQEGANRMLKAGKKGAIVNIASVLGFGVSKGTIAYATAKAGVIQMTKALGLELAFKGVRVNAIAPGWFVTEINREYLTSEQGSKLTREIPVGRFGQDGDLDGALLLLVSDAGAYIAGATIVVDGGQVVALRG